MYKVLRFLLFLILILIASLTIYDLNNALTIVKNNDQLGNAIFRKYLTMLFSEFGATLLVYIFIDIADNIDQIRINTSKNE